MKNIYFWFSTFLLRLFHFLCWYMFELLDCISIYFRFGTNVSHWILIGTSYNLQSDLILISLDTHSFVCALICRDIQRESSMWKQIELHRVRFCLNFQTAKQHRVRNSGYIIKVRWIILKSHIKYPNRIKCLNRNHILNTIKLYVCVCNCKNHSKSFVEAFSIVNI